MKKLSTTRILRTCALTTAGSLLLLNGCTWMDVYEQGQQPMEAVQVFTVGGGAIQQLILDDVNQDGMLDVVALVGPSKPQGTPYMQALEPGNRVLALAGDNKGGFKPLLDVDAVEFRPTHLGVWHPNGASNSQIAMYGTRANGEGVVNLLSVGSQDLEGVSNFDLGSSATQVALQATSTHAGGGEQLVVGGNFQPAAGTGNTVQNPDNTGYAPSQQGQIKVLDHPQADHFTTLGPLDLPGVGTTTASPLAVADFNADGRLDVISTDTLSAGVVVHLQQVDGSFLRQASVPWGIVDTPVQVVTGDFNADQKTDVRVIFESCHDAYYENNNGTLAYPTLFHTVMDPTLHAVVADLDGDQDQDMLLTGINGAVEVLLLDKNGQVEQQSARRVVVVQGTHDASTDSAPLAVRVAQNVMSKVSTRLAGLASAFLPVNGEVMAAGADLNKDGKPDLVFGTNDGQILLYQGE